MICLLRQQSVVTQKAPIAVHLACKNYMQFYMRNYMQISCRVSGMRGRTPFFLHIKKHLTSGPPPWRGNGPGLAY
jgi:hypothetical protein